MSSALLAPENLGMIERLLVELGYPPRRGAGQEASRARLLRDAVKGSVSLETDLRRLLAERVKPARRWRRTYSPGKIGFPYGRQERMLPSPEEEFNVAGLSFPIGSTDHSDTVGGSEKCGWKNRDRVAMNNGYALAAAVRTQAG
ncbi:hypothetical protein AB4Z10_09160 [Bosea sp. RAF48]|uniref:hypothetical protein n=1 Tax=Bosea sp. RAF48 TaxID=3237480 RepID=UPI003F938F37